MNFAIGCDLGGTNLRAGIVDTHAGQVIHLLSVPTLAREGHDAVIDRMVALFQKAIHQSGISKSEIDGIGIGVPGVLDPDRGMVLFLPNLHGGWKNIPLCKIIKSSIGLPVYLINDVRSITLGEWKFGAGKGVSSMVCFAIGTGIGGGVVVNDNLIMGINGTAGELGHTIIDPDGPQCGCGNHGCLEAYASGPAIAAMGIKAVKQGRTTLIGKLTDYDLNKITPEVIAEAAKKGDLIAKEIYEHVGRLIGIAAVNISLALVPECIVIGGGVASAGELLLEPIRRTIQERIFVIPKEKIKIVPAVLGDKAGILGSAKWVNMKIDQIMEMK
jgi:glucokinase